MFIIKCANSADIKQIKNQLKFFNELVIEPTEKLKKTLLKIRKMKLILSSEFNECMQLIEIILNYKIYNIYNIEAMQEDQAIQVLNNLKVQNNQIKINITSLSEQAKHIYKIFLKKSIPYDNLFILIFIQLGELALYISIAIMFLVIATYFYNRFNSNLFVIYKSNRRNSKPKDLNLLK
jgi:hypothetical protein